MFTHDFWKCFTAHSSFCFSKNWSLLHSTAFRCQVLQINSLSQHRRVKDLWTDIVRFVKSDQLPNFNKKWWEIGRIANKENASFFCVSKSILYFPSNDNGDTVCGGFPGFMSVEIWGLEHVFVQLHILFFTRLLTKVPLHYIHLRKVGK